MGCHRLEAAADTHPEAAAAAAWLPAAAVDSLVACHNLEAAFHREGSLVGRHTLVEAVAACLAAEGILAAACRTHLAAAAADTLAVAHTDTLAAAFPGSPAASAASHLQVVAARVHQRAVASASCGLP